MARLPTLKPGLATVKPRLAHSSPEGEVERNRARDDGQPWRRLYKTARWQGLKRLVHERDGYVCQATGAVCIGRHPADTSPVADHIVSPGEVWERTGDWAKVLAAFFDMTNVRTVSKAYHDGPRQSGQRRARRERGGGSKG